MAVLPGFIEVFNRFPHPFEFQENSRPYVIPAHETAVMTVAMAMCCLRASRYFTNIDGVPSYGCVIVGDHESPSEPLDVDYKPVYELELPNEITIGGVTYGPPEVIKTPQQQLLGPKKAIDRKMSFAADGGGNVG